MRLVKKIIVHCADTPDNMDIGVKEIRQWHMEEHDWNDIGYHYVIRRNGKVEQGRPISLYGAHCYGQNRDSIGVCMVGRDRFEDAQHESLRALIRGINDEYGIMEVHGHNEYSDKLCPGFSVPEWLEKYKI